LNGRLAAVVIHYADADRTETCVRSFLAADLHVIVVDNSGTYVGESRPGEVIRPGANLGYSGAANVGLRRAFELAPFALLANDDVTLEHPEGLTALVDRLEADPGIGIAGPLVAGPDGKPQPTIERWRSLARAPGLLLHRAPRLPAQEAEVEAVTGVCMAISRAAFEAVDGFDESYFLYGEEVDLCYRMRVAGYRTVFIPAPSIVHHHEPGEVRGDAARLIRVNYVRSCRDHQSYLSAVTVGVLFLIAACIRRRDPRPLARALYRLLVRESSFADRVLVPGLIAIWIVFLGLGSSYDERLRSIGDAGKYAIPVVLVLLELPLFARGPRRYLDALRPWVFHTSIAALLAFGAASVAWSVLPHHTLAYFLGLVLMFAAVGLGPWRIARSREGAHAIAGGMLAGAAVVVIANVLAIVVFPNLVAARSGPTSPHRFRGILENPDEIGGYVLVAGLALGRAIERGRKLRRLSRRQRLDLPVIVIGLVFTVELVLSASRSGVLLLLLSIAILAAGAFGGRRGVLAAAGIALACAVLGVAVLSSSSVRKALPSAVRPSSLSTLGGRTEAWSASIHLIGRRPFGGFGLGSETQMSFAYRDDGQRLFLACEAIGNAWSTPTPKRQPDCPAEIPLSRLLAGFSGSNSHNSFLGLGVQLGVFVTIAACAALLLAIARIGLAIRRSRIFEIALFAGVVAGVGWGIVETYLLSPGNIVAPVFWILLVLGLAGSAETADA
jgi:GT2 family glycosyltransferase